MLFLIPLESYSSFFKPIVESIHFSHSREEFNPRDLVASVIHELIHYIQDVTNKFPQLRNAKERLRLGKNAPWEKEAYALMYKLTDSFLESCDFYWNDDFDMCQSVQRVV